MLERELRGVFANEAADSLARVESLLTCRRQRPADRALLEALFREFHTMKVGAAAAGFSQAARELHDAESLLDAVRNGAHDVGDPALDGLASMVERVREAVCPAGVSRPDAGRPSAATALSDLWPVLVRATAEAAAAEHKFVVLETDDGDRALGLTTVDALRGVLLHLVRNAVAHGIEPPERRAAAGKPRVGCVRLRAEASADVLHVTVEDDGAGLDFAAIAAVGRQRGWIAPEDDADREALAALILRSGFSTRTTATTLAGRGVGLDAVAHTVESLGGYLTVESRDGAGCAMHVLLPLDAPLPDRHPSPELVTRESAAEATLGPA